MGTLMMAYSAVPVLRHLFHRGVLIVALARAMAAIAVAAAPRATGASTIHFAPLTSLAFATLCGVLQFVDVTRRRELVLFANLGIGPNWVALSAVIPALAIEAAIAATA